MTDETTKAGQTVDAAIDDMTAALERYVETARYAGEVADWRETPATETSDDEPE